MQSLRRAKRELFRGDFSNSHGARGRMVVQSALIAAGAYLVATPGTVLDPFNFQDDVAHFGVRPYDVHGFWPYFSRLWEYLALVLMSPQPWIAAILTTMAAMGLIVTWLRSRPLGTALGFLFVFYSVYFSCQVVFVVGNFLLLLPAFAYLAAVGIEVDRSATTRHQFSAAFLADLANV